MGGGLTFFPGAIKNPGVWPGEKLGGKKKPPLKTGFGGTEEPPEILRFRVSVQAKGGGKNKGEKNNKKLKKMGFPGKTIGGGGMDDKRGPNPSRPVGGADWGKGGACLPRFGPICPPKKKTGWDIWGPKGGGARGAGDVFRKTRFPPTGGEIFFPKGGLENKKIF